MNPPTVRRFLWATTTLLVTAGSPSWAGKTTFDPSVAFDAQYTDNVYYSTPEGPSDVSSGWTLDLPVRRRWKTGGLGFGVSASYRAYQDFGALDHPEYRANFDFKEHTRRSGFNVSASFTRTQEQANLENPDNSQPFLTDRTDRDLAQVAFDFDRKAGERWSWRLGANAATRRYEPIDDVVLGGAQVEDRDEYGATFGFLRDLSRKSGLGVVLEHREFQLEQSGDESSNSVALALQHRSSRTSSWRFLAGAFRSSGKAADGSDTEDERTGFRFGTQYQRSLRSMNLTFNIDHAPTSGGDLSGTSTNTAAGLTLTGTSWGTWTWRSALRVDRREPADSAQPSQTGVVVAGGVGHSFSRMLGWALNATYLDQSGDSSGVATRADSVFTATLGLVWHPWGRTPSAGG